MAKTKAVLSIVLLFIVTTAHAAIIPLSWQPPLTYIEDTGTCPSTGTERGPIDKPIDYRINCVGPDSNHEALTSNTQFDLDVGTEYGTWYCVVFASVVMTIDGQPEVKESCPSNMVVTEVYGPRLLDPTGVTVN